jgi:hypothetical protein
MVCVEALAATEALLRSKLPPLCRRNTVRTFYSTFPEEDLFESEGEFEESASATATQPIFTATKTFASAFTSTELGDKPPMNVPTMTEDAPQIPDTVQQKPALPFGFPPVMTASAPESGHPPPEVSRSAQQENMTRSPFASVMTLPEMPKIQSPNIPVIEAEEQDTVAPEPITMPTEALSDLEQEFMLVDADPDEE